MEEIQQQEKKLFNLPENSWDNIYYLINEHVLRVVLDFPKRETG